MELRMSQCVAKDVALLVLDLVKVLHQVLAVVDEPVAERVRHLFVNDGQLGDVGEHDYIQLDFPRSNTIS